MVKIKGWTKVKENKNTIEWKGVDGDTMNVYTIKDDNFNEKYMVGANSMLHIRKFMTKSQAKSFAVKYMKAHPIG